jgi:hypothetical protein
MRKIQRPRLIVPFCLLLVFLTLSLACRRKPFTVSPSPITVADGSMVVRTNSQVKLDSSATTNVVTISGGFACSIDANGKHYNVDGMDWSITSYDTKAKVSTTSPGGAASAGAIIYATGPDAQPLQSDPFNEGPGYEFGVEQVKFSPATGSGGGLDPSLDCGSATKLCKIVINYKSSCH